MQKPDGLPAIGQNSLSFFQHLQRDLKLWSCPQARNPASADAFPKRLPPQRELPAVRLTEDNPLPTQKPDGLLSRRAKFPFYFPTTYNVISNSRAAVFAGNVTFSFVPSISNVQSPVEG